jgi:hypothetical protein
MPYIKDDEQKKAIDAALSTLPDIERPGDLNYAVTKLMLLFVRGKDGSWPMGYAVASAAIGAIECAKQEFYRRLLSAYEDSKKEENGDVY